MKLYGNSFTAQQLIHLLDKHKTITEVSKIIGRAVSTTHDWYTDIKRRKTLGVYSKDEMQSEGTNRVLVIGDCHMPAMHKDYLGHCKNMYDKHNCTMTINIGDVFDNHYISYHEKDIHNIQCNDEYEAALEMSCKMFEMFPNGIWVLGNHDDLPTRQRKSMFLPKFVMKEMREIYNVPDSWSITNKAIVDDVLYVHRFKGAGKYTSANAARNLNRSVVTGHEHTKASIFYFQNEFKRWFGMSVGCGIDIDNECFEDRFSYQDEYIYKPILSCGVVYDRTRGYIEPMI